MRPCTTWMVICPLGGDLEGDGAALGRRTKRHITDALEFGVENAEHAYVEFVMSPGNARQDGKSNKFPAQNGMTMARMMLDHITRECGDMHDRVKIIGQHVWGTKAELLALKAHVERVRAAGHTNVEPHVFCSWWHKYRTWRLAQSIMPEARVHAVWDTFELRGMIEEPFKIAGEILRSNSPWFDEKLATFRERG